MVSREKAHVGVIDRGGTEWSSHRMAEGLDARLSAFGIDVTLREIYADVLG